MADGEGGGGGRDEGTAVMYCDFTSLHCQVTIRENEERESRENEERRERQRQKQRERERKREREREKTLIERRHRRL